MKDEKKTKAQLVGELEKLRRRVAELEQAENRRNAEGVTERQQLLSIFDSIDEVVYFTDPKTYEIVYVNRATRERFGEHIVGKKCYKTLQGVDAPCEFCTNDRILGENLGKPYIWEFQNSINGRWYRCIDRAIRWPDGRWLRYEMAIDINDRKQAAAESIRLSNAVRMSTESIVLADLEGTITDVNEATLKMYGTDDKTDLIGTSSFELIAPEDREEAMAAMQEVIDKGYLKDQEYHVVTKDGIEVPVEMSVSIMRGVDGEPIGFVEVTRDITERKQAKEALRLQFVNLAETVSRIFSLRNPYVATHQQGTAKLARAVGEKMGLDEDRLQSLYIGSLLHDIGKVAVPEGILRKPGELSEAEWGVVRTHPQRGYDVLRDANLPPLVAELALHHHERLDGSGYPGGLKGDKLSLEVRILAVCNVVNAMSLRHPYRPARSKEEITEEITNGKGTKYDPDVVDVLVEMIENGELELAKG